MDKQQQPQQSRKKNIIFAIAAVVAVIVVGLIAYPILSKIKNEQALGDGASQDQFQTTPELSSALQAECQQSALKISKMSDIDELENEYRAFAESCREVYFAIDGESSFRKEGMYGDLVVDIAHAIAKSDKQKALELFKFAKSLQPWEFYLGPVSCDSHHVIDAYVESLELPTERQCIKISEYKEKLSTPLVNKRYDVLKALVSSEEVVWMGQPESDVGCPEKISEVIQVMQKLTPGPITIEEPPQEGGEITDLILAIKSNGEDRVALILRPVNDCLQLRSLLVSNLEVSE